MTNCNKCLWATRDGGCASCDCEYIDQQEAYEAFKNKPIRCKDCKYWKSNTQFCMAFTAMNVAHRMHENGYCSIAERRTDE